MYQWCGLKSRRGKNKNLTALKFNSNTVWFNFQMYIHTHTHTTKRHDIWRRKSRSWLDYIMHKHLVVLNMITEFQPSPLNNWISNCKTIKACTHSLTLKNIYFVVWSKYYFYYSLFCFAYCVVLQLYCYIDIELRHSVLFCCILRRKMKMQCNVFISIIELF